ncbi:MAG: T9SS type A sorting domain-containing protein [Bacteroidetes bacterium]|nr:T9SS type A sorting domain-containing protein [Bacteroidota bacterium]
MKISVYKIFLFAAVLLSASLLFPKELSVKSKSSIILQFVTTNGFGNNLYIDNVMTGTRPALDIAVTAIDNIKKDTTFLPEMQSVTIVPEINVTNLGLDAYSSGFTLSLEIPELMYSSTDTASSILSGQTFIFLMDSVTIPAGMNISLTAYVSAPLDTIGKNDTLKQTSVFLSAAKKKLLVEEFTSSTSPSCGANNPFLDTLIYNHFNNVCALKYHVGFPPPGIDSMYIADSNDVNARRDYYFVNTVPYTILNGVSRLPLPYTYLDTALFSYYFLDSVYNGSPVSVSVSDLLLPGDTIQSTINVNVYYPLKSNNIRLKVAAVEKLVNYSGPIGASDEFSFYDVFRKFIPDSTGYPLSSIPGHYDFTVKYHVDSPWQDTSMYTLAFVQNDDNREVYNCGKGISISKLKRPAAYRKNIAVRKPDYDTKKFPLSGFASKKPGGMPFDAVSYLNYQTFEGPFPPVGWTISNPDGYLSFEKFTGVNGTTLGGESSIRGPFYDYANIGQKDTLYSAVFDSVSVYDTLSFDYAYAVYLSTYSDSLTVNISTNGGQTWYAIFEEGGYGLSTALSTTQPFYPYNSSQWKTYRYPLQGVLPPENPQTAVPLRYELLQNYPNPFNPRTTIEFRIRKEGFVTLKIYDILGRLIKTLVSKNLKPDSYSEIFDASGLSSGIYFYRLDASDFSLTKKMVVLK